VPNDDVTILESSGDAAHPAVIALQNGSYHMGISNGYTPAVITFWNSTTDDGNRVVIKEAGDFDATEAQTAITTFLTEPSVTSGNFYRFWNLGGKGAYIQPSSFVSTGNQSESVVLRVNEVGTTPVGKKIYSLCDEKTSKYLSYTDVAQSSGDNADRFAWTDAATNSKFVFNVANGDNNVNIRPAYPADDNYVRLWSESSGAFTASNLILYNANGINLADRGVYKWNMTDLTINVSYKTMFEGEQKGENVTAKSYIGNIAILPSTLASAVPFSCAYTFDKNEVTAADELFTATIIWDGPVRYTTTSSAPEYYNLNIRSKYLVYDDEATGDVKLQDTSEPFSNDASWAFIGDPYTGFKIINKTAGTNKYLTYTSVVTGANRPANETDMTKNNIQFVNDEDFTDQYWYIDSNTGGFCLRMKGNTDIYFHHQSGTPTYLRTCSVSEWSYVHNDAGSTLVASTDEEVLFNLYDSMKYWSFGTSVGQMNTTDSGVVTNEEATATLTSTGAAIASSVTAAYPDCYTALLTVKNNMALVEPTAGFYRLKNVATNKYLTATALASGYTDTNKYVYANGNSSDASTVVRLFDKDGDGHLYMYNQGAGFGWIATSTGGKVGWITSNPDKYVNWFQGKVANQIAFAICLGNGTGAYASYLTQGIYTVDTNDEAVVAATDYTDDKAQWVVEAATSVTVTLNSDGAGTPTYYATFCAPFSYTVSGATAYTLAESGEYLVPTPIDGEVAAGTPVLLKGSSATATLTIGSSYATSPVDDTALTGTYLATTIDGANDYVLGIDGGVVGFYHWDTNTLGANRAYVDTPAGIKGFAIDWSGETGIHAIDNGRLTMDNATYNLSGQRVTKAQKGIFIVNGKKVVK